MLAAQAALSACGFRPAYAPGSRGAALDGALVVEADGSLDGFALAQALRDRLGPPVRARYRLRYGVDVDRERVAVTTAQSTRRFNLIGRARYRVQDIATATPVTDGEVQAFTAFSGLGNAVATEAAERDGTERLMRLLADRIVVALLATPELTAPAPAALLAAGGAG